MRWIGLLLLVLLAGSALVVAADADVDRLYAEGIELRRSGGDASKALRLFEQIVTEEPGHTDAWFQIGLIHHDAGIESANFRNMRWANQAFGKVLERQPEHDSARYLLAQNLVSLGEIADAEAQLRVFLKQRKQALERLSAEEAKAPGAATQAALASARENLVDTLYALGMIASKRGQSEMARSYLRRVLKQQPQHPPALLALASELQLTGAEADETLARKVIKQLTKMLRGLSPAATNTLENFFRLRDPSSPELLRPLAHLAPEFESQYAGRSLALADVVAQHPYGADNGRQLQAWRRQRSPGVFRAATAEASEDPLQAHFGWTAGRWFQGPTGGDYVRRAAGRTMLRVQQKFPSTDLFDYRAVARHQTVAEYLEAIAAGDEAACHLFTGLQPPGAKASRTQAYLRPPLVDLERDIPAAPSFLLQPEPQEISAAYLAFGNCSASGQRQVAALRHDNSDLVIVQVAGATTITLMAPDQAAGAQLPTFGTLGRITPSGVMMYQRRPGLPEVYSHAGHYTQFPAAVAVPADLSSSSPLRAEHLELEGGEATQKAFAELREEGVGVHIKLAPGDSLFVPAGWYHQEASASPGVRATITYWLPVGTDLPKEAVKEEL